MNDRQWKKACKRAVAEVERRRPGVYTFTPSDGEDTVYAPPGYQPPRRDGRAGRRYATPPVGTPMYYERSGYYEPETEALTALDVLNRIDHEDWWEAREDAELEEMCAPAFDEVLDETCRALWFALSTPVSQETTR